MLRQIRSGQALVDIVPIFWNCYDIRFYSPTNCLAKDQFFPSTNWNAHYNDISGQLDYYVTTNGTYVDMGNPNWSTNWGYSTTGTPFVVWRIVQPWSSPECLNVTKIQGGTACIYKYRYDESLQGWTLDSGDGLKIESRSSVWDQAGTTRTEDYIVKDASGHVAHQEVNDYHRFPWGESRVLTVQDVDGDALSVSRGYYEDPQETGKYMRTAWEQQADGGFVWYDYDTEGRIVTEARTWKDMELSSTLPDVALDDAQITTYSFAPLDPADDGTAQPRKPRTITEQIAGVVVAKTYFAFVAATNGETTEIREECPSAAATNGNAGNRRTITIHYPESEELWPGQIKSIVYPDGRLDQYGYERGHYVGNGQEPGVFTVGTGNYVRVTLNHGTTTHTNGTGKTTREVTVRDILRGDVLRETYVFDSAQYVRGDWTVQTYDDAGHLLVSRFANGLSRSSVWSDCCGKGADVEVDGTTTYYDYDVLGRLKSRTKDGSASSTYPTQPNITTRYRRDAEGQVLLETTSATNLLLATSSEYDRVGRLIRTVDSAGLETRYAYSQGGRITTVVHPGGATEITENYLDGRTKSVTGTGVVPRFYDYGVNADGSQWTLVHTGAENSPPWEKSTVDMLGRPLRDEKPGFGGTLLTTTYDYNEKSQLKSVRQWAGDPPAVPVGVPSLYEYDELGEQVRVAQDVNGNGAIDLAGPDQVNETQTRIVKIAGERWRETLSKVYAAETSAVPVTISVQRRSMKGAGSGSSAGEEQSMDIRGNKSLATVDIHPIPKAVVTTRDVPDSSQNAISLVVNGLLQSDTTPTGLTTTYVYDGLGRMIGNTDPRTGTATTHFNELGQVDYVEDAAGNRTTYAYDPVTGLRIGVVDALSNEVHTAYDLQGRATNIWGATYPVAYEYDAYGRMATMKTWRDTNGAPDVTRWYYDEATGLLTNKVYADGNGISYEYDAVGRLTKRIWARGVSAAYAYDLIGQLTNIDYSDATPDVTFTYDRMGRQVTVTDVLGTRTNAYDPVTLDLATEHLSDGRILTRSYDSLGRPSRISLDGDYVANYAYNAAGRFSAITSAVFSVTTAVNYAYLPKSDLLSGWTIRDGSRTNPPVIVSRTYELNRDLVSSIVNTSSVAFVSRFDYVNDQVGRRTGRNDYTSRVASVSSTFGYNVRSELAAAVMGTNEFGYQYDAIGNRQAAIANNGNNLYQANALNQYDSILPAIGTPAYDLDGNMISNGTCTYTWDAENRLVEVRASGAILVKNTYDYMGRRVQKETAAATNLFLYDGWNLIQERKGTSLYSYAWGLDLSGTLQGAGGVGGLVARTQHSVTGTTNALISAYYFVSDANGNITDAINRTNSAVRYRYQYDPYGNLMVSLNPNLRDFKFRFSSKYCDDESGLYNYGYRFYSPGLGRWIGRDPIEEEGGLNVYAFVSNDPIGFFDPLGDIVYGIDGTWANALREPDPNSPDMYMTSTKRIVNEVKNENREYTPGPGGTVSGFDRLYAGLTGAGSSSIRGQVHSDICRAYCKGDCNVALVGWSRGAVIAMGVASDLQSMGCTCSGTTFKPIKVRFVGLFDAVQMMPGNWPQSVPSNVENFAHAQKSARQWIFPTKDYGGTSGAFSLNTPRKIRKSVCSGSPHGPCRWVYRDSYESLHADIGVSVNATDAYSWIKSRAAAAGIQF